MHNIPVDKVHTENAGPVFILAPSTRGQHIVSMPKGADFIGWDISRNKQWFRL